LIDDWSKVVERVGSHLIIISRTARNLVRWLSLSTCYYLFFAWPVNQIIFPFDLDV